MLVNINEMTAEELFALANKKKQAEEEAAKLVEVRQQLEELHKQREQVVREFEKILAESDKEIAALQKKRAQLLELHQAELSRRDEELQAMEDDLAGRESALTVDTMKKKPAAAGPQSDAAEADTGEEANVPELSAVDESVDVEKPARSKSRNRLDEEQAENIIDILAGRKSISESMLKEQLRLRGISTAGLDKVLQRLEDAGEVINRGYGSYAPVTKKR